MPIDEYGFLGKDIKQYESKLEEQYKDVFNFYEEFNHYLNNIQFKIIKKNYDLFSENGKPKSFNLKERIEQLMEQRNDLEMVANYYCTFYKIASLGIHSSPDNLNKYWIFDNDAGGIKDFHLGPRAEKCEINCIIASIHFMIMITECLFAYFKYPKKENVSQFWKITKKLGSKYKYFENIE